MLVRLTLLSDLIWEGFVAWVLGIVILARKYTKVATFIVCVPTAIFGYSTRHYPVQMDDPVFWISFGALGMDLFLVAYFLFVWIWGRERNTDLELTHDR